jgi:hypothetical protein
MNSNPVHPTSYKRGFTAYRGKGPGWDFWAARAGNESMCNTGLTAKPITRRKERRRNRKEILKSLSEG